MIDLSKAEAAADRLKVDLHTASYEQSERYLRAREFVAGLRQRAAFLEGERARIDRELAELQKCANRLTV